MTSKSKVLAVLTAPSFAPFAIGVVLLTSVGCAGLPPSTEKTGQPTTSIGQPPAVAAPRLSLPNASDSVKFLAIGDSGTGDRAQYDVAARIAAAHEVFSFDRALMLGDNLSGRENAAAYRDKFERLYGPLLRAGVKFYASAARQEA